VHPTPVCLPRNFTVQMRNPEGTIMGVYERWILPRLLDLAMRNRLLDDYRQRTIETARGLVLEIGVSQRGLALVLGETSITRNARASRTKRRAASRWSSAIAAAARPRVIRPAASPLDGFL
jgi:hypothetical protein